MTALSLPVILYLVSFCFARGAGVNSLIKIDASAAGRDDFSFTAQQKNESPENKGFRRCDLLCVGEKDAPTPNPPFHQAANQQSVCGLKRRSSGMSALWLFEKKSEQAI